MIAAEETLAIEKEDQQAAPFPHLVVESMLQLFGEYLSQIGCSVDRSKVRFEDTDEGREILAQEGRLRTVYNYMKKLLLGHWRKDQLFSHLALHQSDVGYTKPVHCDRPNRLTTNVLFFCDKQDIGMEGGNLLVHEHKSKKARPSLNERHPRDEETDVIAAITPARNLGALLLDCNKSYHSVETISALEKYRNWCYICVSSREDIIW